MTKEQVELATRMNDSGIDWQIVANHFKVSYRTLLKYRKQYSN